MSAPGLLHGLSSSVSGFKSKIDSPLKVPSASKSIAFAVLALAAVVAVVVTPGPRFVILILTGPAVDPNGN